MLAFPLLSTTEVSLDRLRSLRRRAAELLSNAAGDLSPFIHEIDGLTFVRTPSSISKKDDVNVTTTCSCLMSLTLTDRAKDVYIDETKEKVKKAFELVVRAPWMSSGLTENNAFTTVLVLRALGFLVQRGYLDEAYGLDPAKEWELDLGIKDADGLLAKLRDSTNPTSKFIWQSFSERGRDKLAKAPTPGDEDKRKGVLAGELQRLIQTGRLYEESRFPTATPEMVAKFTDDVVGYQLASANRQLLAATYAGHFTPLSHRTLADIAIEISADPRQRFFSINDYQPAAAVVYWFVDGIHRAEIALPHAHWMNMCRWASGEFNHERSLVASQQDPKMDPVSMAMAACLCARLRTISEELDEDGESKWGANEETLAVLPSRVELKHSIQELLKFQTHGIWPKYFPMFHYQDAGSNFCFTFELLEAVLYEFGRDDANVLDENACIASLEAALTWCENNRLWRKGQKHHGWNSGGYIKTLQDGEPESWATAVVHMFLWELVDVLSIRIQARLIKRYEARTFGPKDDSISKLLDIAIYEKGDIKSLKTILKSQFVDSYKGKNEHDLRRQKSQHPRSALLFGPPGTSKTKISEALAKDLDWPLIQIDPSHFLKKGLDGIYVCANEVFSDLMDLAGVLVLFDEMDALVQTRDGVARMDVASQFLTTFMLPKLTGLHDRAQVIFLMATNFQERFDPAIKRTGRFDLLLCMGPPTLDEKLAQLHRFMGESASTKSQELAQSISSKLVNEPKAKLQLELYTFGEFSSFMKALKTNESDPWLKGKTMTDRDLEGIITKDSKYVILRTEDLEQLEAFGLRDWKSMDDLDKFASQTKRPTDDASKISHLIRYIFDRQESRQQM